nr:MAG TPA: hypothetical protein [Caudoviricetes sp.]
MISACWLVILLTILFSVLFWSIAYKNIKERS